MYHLVVLHHHRRIDADERTIYLAKGDSASIPLSSTKAFWAYSTSLLVALPYLTFIICWKSSFVCVCDVRTVPLEGNIFGYSVRFIFSERMTLPLPVLYPARNEVEKNVQMMIMRTPIRSKTFRIQVVLNFCWGGRRGEVRRRFDSAFFDLSG